MVPLFTAADHWVRSDSKRKSVSVTEALRIAVSARPFGEAAEDRYVIDWYSYGYSYPSTRTQLIRDGNRTLSAIASANDAEYEQRIRDLGHRS